MNVTHRLTVFAVGLLGGFFVLGTAAGADAGRGLGVAEADLPPLEQVAAVLHAHPAVLAAGAGVREQEAVRDRLRAGPYELTVTAATARRKDRNEQLRTREHEIGIERSFRLPGKAARDAEIGALGISEARFALGDARHETARLLLARWFDWQRAASAVSDWQAQGENLRAQRVVAEKKVKLGEAARLELLQTEAQLFQAEAETARAHNEAAQVALEWQQNFPGIDLPQLPVVVLPQALPVDSLEHAAWRARMLEENHELAVARSAARKSRVQAGRLDAERLPDPSLGVALGRENNGAERVVGVQLSIPLPGAGRAADARAGQAAAEAASAREAQALIRAESTARQTIQRALSSYTQWQRLAEVAERLDENLRLLEKAWRLGEGQFNELQQTRRQAIEARLSASRARLDANEARYRLLLDMHVLWADEEEESAHEAGFGEHQH
ncbi:TolC family protein [Azonexus sp.]|uniref:TolC family protein n=1 Tax=Azonexus sp. TaxID=1872668 RepID=UPI0039E59DF0